MNTSVPLRNLPPDSAWNEAMRRSFLASIGGFFVPNLLANFGTIPQLHPDFHFMPGVCGGAGAFISSMALHLAYFHKKWIQWIAAAILGLVLPYGATWLWFRTSRPSASAGLLQLCGPTLLTAIIIYFSFMLWHANLSTFTFDSLAEQIATDDYGELKSKWERVTYRTFWAIGAVALIFLLLAVIGGQ